MSSNFFWLTNHPDSIGCYTARPTKKIGDDQYKQTANATGYDVLILPGVRQGADSDVNNTDIV